MSDKIVSEMAFESMLMSVYASAFAIVSCHVESVDVSEYVYGQSVLCVKLKSS